jgi:cell shape-determining protein MreC
LLTRWENAQETAASIIRLQEEANRLRLENRMLRNIRGQLQDRAGGFRFPTAGIIARGADAGAGIIQVNRGGKDGVVEGVPAVDGANLVGRISRTNRMTSSLQLITTPGTRLNVIITPQLAPLSQMTSLESPPCQLDVIAPGRFGATVPIDAVVRVGSYARLVDTDWPDSVQGMIVGKVSSVEPLSDDPLSWKRVIVEPRATLRYLGSVTLIVQQRDEDN